MSAAAATMSFMSPTKGVLSQRPAWWRRSSRHRPRPTRLMCPPISGPGGMLLPSAYVGLVEVDESRKRLP